MSENKTNLSFITNDSTRKAILKKRRATIFKKAEELSVLSDVQTCAVVYSPGEADPAIFPSHQTVKQMLEKFQTMSIVERSQKMVTYERFLAQRVEKETQKKNKETKKNDLTESQEIMNHIFEGNDLTKLDIRRLNNLSFLTVDKLNQLEAREGAPSVSPLASLSLPPHQMVEVEVEDQGAIHAQATDLHVSSTVPPLMQQLMNDKWFMETMDFHQESDVGLPSNYVADTNIGENAEDFPMDLDTLFPHIYSP